MRWIVFALGIALAVGGLAAISQGYGIIQVERGWTLVIAGATALGSGVITIALGVVVVRLEALLGLPAVEPAEEAEELDLTAEDQDAFPFEPASRSHPEPTRERAPFGEPAGEGPAASMPAEVAAAVAPLVEAAEPPPEQDMRQPALRSPDFRRWRQSEAQESEARAPAAPASATTAARVRPRATFVPPPMPAKPVPPPKIWPSETSEPEPPGTPDLTPPPRFARPQPSRTEAGHSGEKREYDWLEMALAGTESEQAALPKPAAAEAEAEAMVEEAEPTAESSAANPFAGRDPRESVTIRAPLPAPAPRPAPVPEPARVHVPERAPIAALEPADILEPAHLPEASHAHEPEAQHDLAPEPALVSAVADERADAMHREGAVVAAAAEEEPTAPAIVGRYESNGASYALFADGSIEAATASGVYRFASMAELKDFVESKG